MSTIGPGDFLESVRTIVVGPARIDAGSVYVCEEVVVENLRARCTCGSNAAVRLQGVLDPGPYRWCICNFRRHGPKRGAFDLLLEPVKELA